MKEEETPRVAWFISSHGFGHAARASAIMEALLRRRPAIEFELFTSVPSWFFERSIGGCFRHHAILHDVGLAQRSPTEEDIPETVRRLGELLPYRDDLVNDVSRIVRETGCRSVVCDIAPLGIEAARRAGVPSVLVENFCWDWIYEGYFDLDGRMRPFAAYLGELFDAADYLVQTEPSCVAREADLTTPPVSRRGRRPRSVVRMELGVEPSKELVLLTMGGMAADYGFLGRLRGRPEQFLVSRPVPDLVRDENLLYFPPDTTLFHPDLLAASDAVIGKIGYSTLAEAYHAGRPYGYLTRPRFRESAPLSAFARERMGGIEIDDESFRTGAWIDQHLPRLLGMPPVERTERNGADVAADWFMERGLA